jgi:hypothetical protein
MVNPAKAGLYRSRRWRDYWGTVFNFIPRFIIQEEVYVNIK